MSRKSYASPLPNTFAPTTTTTAAAAAAAAASANFAGYDVNQIHQYRSQLAINGQDANVSDVNTSVRSSFKPVASTRRESLLNPTLEVVHHHQRPKSTSINQAASPPPILTNRTTSIQPRMVTSDAHSRPVSHPASPDKSNGEITNSVYILPMSPGSEINRSTGDTGLFWNELSVASNASQHHQHHQQQRHLTGTPQTTIVNHTVNYNASDTISIASSSMNHQNDNDDDDDLGSFIDVNRCWLNDEGKSATYSSNIPNYSSIGSNSLVYRPNSISSRKTIVPSLAQISLSALDSDNESMFSGSAWSGFSRDTSSNATSSIISASNRRATHHSLRNMMTETILNEETIDESGEYTVNVLPDQVSYHNRQDGISASHSYEHEQRVTNQHQHNHASIQRDHRNSNVPVNYPSMDRLTINTNGMNESSLPSPASSTILDYEKSKRISHTQSVSYQMMQPNNTISDYGDRDLSGISSLYSAESSPKTSNNDKYDFSFLDQSFITNDSALSKTPDLSRSTTRSSRATNPDSVNDSFNTSTETYKDDTVKPKTIKESRTEAIAALVRCVQKHIHEFSSLRNEFEYPLRSVADMENMSIFQAFIRDRHNYIFGGVRKLAIFHKFFIEDLTNAVEKFKKNGTLKDIAKAFIAHMPGFRYYLHYIHEYSNVITTLEHLQSQYNPFKKTLAKCQAKIVNRNLYQMLFDIMDHMPAYYKSLENILNLYPPNDVEYAKFKECVEKIEQTALETTRLARRTRQKEQTKLVQSSLDGMGEMLVTPHRRLIYQSNLNNFIFGFKETKNRICFLFDDMLLVAKNKPNGRRNFKYRVHLSNVAICKLPEDRLPNGFVIIAEAGKEYYFQAEANSIYRRWMHYLQEIVAKEQFVPVTHLIHLHELPMFPISSSTTANSSTSSNRQYSNNNTLTSPVVKQRQHKSVIGQIIGNYSNRYTRDSVIDIGNKSWRNDAAIRDRSETL